MNIRHIVRFLAVTLLLSACSSEPTVTQIPDTTIDVVMGSVSGEQISYTINYDTAKWIATPTAAGEDAEYEFEHVDGDVFALVIPERIELDLADLRKIALENAQSISEDAQITFEEDRTVNDVQVHVMKIGGTLYGIAFEYYGYYYGGPAGTVQFITYTSSNLNSLYADDLTELLNGLTITE